MQIAGSEVEFVSSTDEFDDGCFNKYHHLQFVKTPRGRRKVLILVQESFNRAKQLTEVDITCTTKDCQEQRKLLSALIRGAFGSQAVFQSTTLEMLKAPYIAAAEELWIRNAI